MLHINELGHAVGGRTLFRGATLVVPAGRKVGLVGRNGAGKTTLLRLIAGELPPDTGTVSVRTRARVGRVAQEAPGGLQCLLDAVLSADRERTELMAAAERLAEPDADAVGLAEVHERLRAIDAHSAPARAGAILFGLGFSAADQTRSLNEFSGGWRMRVALAAALFVPADLLLLDEPTNHLDLEAALWLENHLARFPGTLILVSHDRRLLNRAVDEIAHIEGGRLVRYTGGFDAFVRTRTERLAREAKLRERQQEEQRRIQAFVDRFRAKATKARQAQSRLKMLARMTPLPAAIEESTAPIAFPAPKALAPPLLVLESVSAGYDPHRPVLRRLDLRLDPDDRIALLGANGNGKTTLMRLLAGRLAPLSGEVRRAPALRCGFFAQHQAEEFALDRSAYAELVRMRPHLSETEIRGHLARFGLGQEKADVAIGDLSGGEKARLLLARIAAESPQILLLDEPTNHLDIDAREALVNALNEFPGAVVIASHDPHVIELACDRLWLVAEGTCRPFEGDLDDYARLVAEARTAQDPAAAKRQQRTGEGDSANRREARRVRAKARAEARPLREAATSAERRLKSLEDEKAALETVLADPAFYSRPASEIAETRIRLAALLKATAEAEDAWLSAHAALEQAVETD